MQKSSVFSSIYREFGGVLYPPHCLVEKTLDESKFMSVVPTQDDVWYWAMAVVSETPICVVSSCDMQLITVENTQHTHLFWLKIRWNPDQTPVADVIAKQVAREVYSVMEVQYLHNRIILK